MCIHITDMFGVYTCQCQTPIYVTTSGACVFVFHRLKAIAFCTHYSVTKNTNTTTLSQILALHQLAYQGETFP